MRSRGLSVLLEAAYRYSGQALRGRPHLGVPPRRFLAALLEATRPHYFALPAGASLAGSAAAPNLELSWRVAAAAAAAGLGWGVGQILNDLMDTEADAVDAPGRPAVRGLLPDGPTMTVAIGAGLAVAALTLLLHPEAYLLVIASTLLMLGYGAAKPIPLLGNLAHGALIATAATIGRVAATPEQSLLTALGGSWPVLVVTGAWSAVYLQSNYEKDRRGDALAHCRTLAHVLGLRASAGLRWVAALVIAVSAARISAVVGTVAWAAWIAALLAITSSAMLVLWHATEAVALRGYRLAVHGAALGMLSLAGAALGQATLLVAVVTSLALTEQAFRRNPQNA